MHAWPAGFPGFDGGAEWGGPAVDIKIGVIYVNENEMAWTGSLAENKIGAGLGQGTYEYLCASCHGDHREGSPPAFPSLVGVTQRLSDKEIAAVIHSGKGRMPSFPVVDDETMTALVAYLKSAESESNKGLEEAIAALRALATPGSGSWT